jgi:RNA dependent RNA polymerase
MTYSAVKCVGVVDPTGKLPPGTIFVSGCGVVEEENGMSPRKMWTDSIFITRFPCTSPRDGIVVDAVRSQPSQMSLDEWNFLKELPFGLVVFSTTGDLPARTADGDLDGDLYLILFDDELLKCIDRQASTREQCLDGSDEQDELIGSELLLDNQMAVVAHKKEGKPNTYIVSVGSELREMTKEEILAGDKDYAIEVLAHRGTGRNVQVELKWSDGSRQWAWLADYKVQLDVILTEYAKANDLLDKAAWRFFKKFALDETTPIYIHKHRENPLEVGMVEVLLHFDDGSQKWTSVEQVPEDGKDLLAAYATENGLVEEQEWRVVRNYIESQNDSWFERTQCFMADLHMLRNYDRLTTVLHTTFKKALREGWDIRVCEELGQAFKDSINIRKHGGKVALTRGIIPLIGETALQEYFIAK